MKRSCIAAAAFAIASAGMNAAAALPEEPVNGVPAQFGVAAATVFDGFRAGHASRGPALPSLPSAEDFADSYRLMVTGAGARDPLPMTMACIGLMAMIAYRRRIL